MKTPPSKDIERAMFGIVTSLDELFEGYLYCKWRYLGHGNGTDMPCPPGFYYMSSEVAPVRSWGMDSSQPGSNTKQGLHAKPKAEVRDRARDRCTPPIHGTGKGGDCLQAFRITQRVDCDYALITATDYNSIAVPWIAFIAVKDLPVLDLTTVEMYKP